MTFHWKDSNLSYLFIKMQDRQISFKRGGELFGEVAQRIRDALAGTKSGDDDKTADTFLFQCSGFELIFERFNTDGVICFHRDEQGFDGLQVTGIRTKDE